MTGRTGGVALHTLLWAGPLSIGLAVVVLVASRPFFTHGPGTPSAGDERAWSALWGSMGIVAVGLVTGLVANVTWLAMTLRHRRPSRGEWIRTAVNVALGVAGARVWFGP